MASLIGTYIVNAIPAGTAGATVLSYRKQLGLDAERQADRIQFVRNRRV